MRPRKTNHNQQTIDVFKQHKILTFTEICLVMQLSVATVRRRLKEWKVISSYNKKGKYYTLPSIPQFNKQGLWKYEGAFFSKHGTMKNTIIHLVQISKSGLSSSELADILSVNPNSYLPQFKQIEGVRKEKHKREMVYFSSDEEVYQRQKKNRFPPEPTTLKLPPDAISIIILVELIKNPSSTPAELSQTLIQSGYNISIQEIENLFESHGLKKN
jgi:hypothetical protein